MMFDGVMTFTRRIFFRTSNVEIGETIFRVKFISNININNVTPLTIFNLKQLFFIYDNKYINN